MNWGRTGRKMRKISNLFTQKDNVAENFSNTTEIKIFHTQSWQENIFKRSS